MSITEKNGLKISSILFDFINKEVIPGTDIQPDKFWDNFKELRDIAIEHEMYTPITQDKEFCGKKIKD